MFNLQSNLSFTRHVGNLFSPQLLELNPDDGCWSYELSLPGSLKNVPVLSSGHGYWNRSIITSNLHAWSRMAPKCRGVNPVIRERGPRLPWHAKRVFLSWST